MQRSGTQPVPHPFPIRLISPVHSCHTLITCHDRSVATELLSKHWQGVQVSSSEALPRPRLRLPRSLWEALSDRIP